MLVRRSTQYSDEDHEEVKALFLRLSQLLEAEATLHALYAAGVDNWEGYTTALDMVGQ